MKHENLYDAMQEIRARPIAKIVKHPGLANGKYAHVCGDVVYVSPAMHQLLTDPDLTAEEYKTIAENIFIVHVTVATGQIYESEIESFLKDVRAMQDRERALYEHHIRTQSRQTT